MLQLTDEGRKGRIAVGVWGDRVRAGFVLLFLLSLFWGALYAGETAVRPSGMNPPPSLQYQPVDADGNAIQGAKRLKAEYFGDPIYRSTVEEGGSRVAFLIPFDTEQRTSDLAFFLGATPGLQEIKLNGNVIQPNVPLDTLRGASDGTALYYMLPASQLRTGTNEIQVFVETQSTILALAPFHIGQATEAARATNMVDLITNIVPIIAISFLIFATLLCFVTNWPNDDRQRIRSLMLLMSAWAARTYFITFQTPFELPFLITSFIYYILEVSVIIAFARHLLAGEAETARWMRWLAWLWVAILAYLLLITVAGFVVGPAIRYWFKAVSYLNSLLLLVVAVSGLALLAWGVASRRDGRWLERLALMFCLLALSVDAGDSTFDLAVPFASHLALTFYAAAPAGLLLGLGVVASIAREASEARRTVVQSNEILAAKLTEQNAELARSYDAQKQMLGRQVMLEERQRIVRDMHDGIGGQLLGLMMQVRSGGVEQKQVEEGLQSSIADLRLIVDSMDTADEGLAETLRSFEHRVRAQVEATGMAFKAEHGLDDGAPGPGPRPTLQILRILQEAVTNAMRHSGASEIVLASGTGANGLIQLSISDNGKGMPAEIKGGRGLTSMRSRAEAVGGSLEIESGSTGTTLSLALPVPE
jgi:two-component system, NarL family, sensor histidine kinase UhpB